MPTLSHLWSVNNNKKTQVASQVSGGCCVSPVCQAFVGWSPLQGWVSPSAGTGLSWRRNGFVVCIGEHEFREYKDHYYHYYYQLYYHNYCYTTAADVLTIASITVSCFSAATRTTIPSNSSTHFARYQGGRFSLAAVLFEFLVQFDFIFISKTKGNKATMKTLTFPKLSIGFFLLLVPLLWCSHRDTTRLEGLVNEWKRAGPHTETIGQIRDQLASLGLIQSPIDPIK